jgi:hypothetical protein
MPSPKCAVHRPGHECEQIRRIAPVEFSANLTTKAHLSRNPNLTAGALKGCDPPSTPSAAEGRSNTAHTLSPTSRISGSTAEHGGAFKSLTYQCISVVALPLSPRPTFLRLAGDWSGWSPREGGIPAADQRTPMGGHVMPWGSRRGSLRANRLGCAGLLHWLLTPRKPRRGEPPAARTRMGTRRSRQRR